MKEFYTFDVFDTCLVRSCGSANNMIDVLSKLVFKGAVHDLERKAFVVARKEAELKTYSPTQNLQSIYNELNYSHSLLLSKDNLLSAELSCEESLLRPIYSIRQKIKQLRKNEARIGFISDMYLPSDFIKKVLIKYELFTEGDFLYVSNEYGLIKSDGSLYRHIHELEHIPYKRWHHTGDNKYSDIAIPKKLGIAVTYVKWQASFYAKKWEEMICIGYNYPAMMAGLSKAIQCRFKKDIQIDFTTDIIAPTFVSFTCRILQNAKQKGIQKLFFCARDSYYCYLIAKKLIHLYGNISINYLKISRASLYDETECNIMNFLKSEGVASISERIGIVDIRSTGKTCIFLNHLLSKNNYNQIYCFNFERCNSIQTKAEDENFSFGYYAEIDDSYLFGHPHIRHLIGHSALYERFFSLNTQKRTIGYNQGVPIFAPTNNNDYTIDNVFEIEKTRIATLNEYVEEFITLHLYEYADEIFQHIALTQLYNFLRYPNKYYLSALSSYKENVNGTFIPYIRKNALMLILWYSPFHKFFNLKRPIWKRGTICYSLPSFITSKLYKNH